MAFQWTDYNRAFLDSLFFLGHQPGQEERPISYPRDPKSRVHLAYYGTTRSGKSFGMEYAVQQLSRGREAGFCFIDPHGASYWRMASFLRECDIAEKVLFWDINDPDFIVHYDPFSVAEQSPSFIAGNLTSALLATLGRTSEASEQPHLKTLTEDGLTALLELNLSFILSHDLFDPEETELKELIGRALGRRSSLLSTIAQMKRVEQRYQELAPPFRRIKNLFADERLKLAFSAPGVDFRQLMDEGWIVLVNAEPRTQADEAASLFIRLLIKQLLMAAKSREPDPDTRPFFVFVDEASRYLTTDTARFLAETAKYGVYLALGMQSAEQARIENEESYINLRANMGAEVVMRLTDYDEAIYFARRFYGPRFDFRSIKHEQERINAIPHTVPHITRSTARPLGPTTIDSSGWSESEDDAGKLTSTSSGSSTTAYAPDVETETGGYHTEYEYQKERIPTFYTPDELEREAAKLFMVRRPGLGQRFGVVRMGELKPRSIEIPELTPPLYSREEMREWLVSYKAHQPATQRKEILTQKLTNLLEDQRSRLAQGVTIETPATPKSKSTKKRYTF